MYQDGINKGIHFVYLFTIVCQHQELGLHGIKGWDSMLVIDWKECRVKWSWHTQNSRS